MAYANTSAERASAPGRFARRIYDLAERWARYTVYRDTLRELQSLSDRDLADLGLHRSLIRRTAYEAAYGA
ncbi:MAG: DUF1127 domain-containing protein [Rhodobacteraceae bacterium]|nr:DUF1127 domain-containing protein [Paracoccaceae bacterium]